MNNKVYSIQYAKLSNIILSMSPDQQDQLFKVAYRIKIGENNNYVWNLGFLNIVFTSGILAGSGFVTICLIIFTLI